MCMVLGLCVPSRKVVICACAAEGWDLWGLHINIMCISRPLKGSQKKSDCAEGHAVIPVLKPPVCVLGCEDAVVIDTVMSYSVMNENTLNK